jgi:NAD-dependent deacetylase
MDFEKLRQIVNESDNIVFFGGAGTSTESGIPDFRSEGGLFQAAGLRHYSPEEILSHSFFMTHTEDFYTFYRSKMIYPDAQPNRGHLALAELENRGQLKAIITQNIDGLHQAAGSKNVIELHGAVRDNFCIACRKHFPLNYVMQPDIPRCDQCGGIVKPDVVLYGENLDTDDLVKASAYIGQAEILIVAGTSLRVQPAAGLIRNYGGNCMVLINRHATPYDGIAHYVIRDGFAKVMHALVHGNETAGN